MLDKFILIILITVVSSPVFSLGMDISYDSFRANYFAAIRSTEPCGSWSLDGKQGNFRVFSASIYGGDMLFIDMVRFDDKNNLVTVERGFGVQELNNDHAEIVYPKITCVAVAENRIKITGRAESGHAPDKKFDFCVEVDAATSSVKYSDSGYIVGPAKPPPPA